MNAKHVRTILLTILNSYTIGNVISAAILCVNTFSQTHEEEAAFMKHYVSSDMTNCSKCGECCTRCENVSLPLLAHKFSRTSGHEPEPYVRTAATTGDHDALAKTPTAETVTTASGADENNDDPYDEHKYVNTVTNKK